MDTTDAEGNLETLLREYQTDPQMQFSPPTTSPMRKRRRESLFTGQAAQRFANRRRQPPAQVFFPSGSVNPNLERLQALTTAGPLWDPEDPGKQ